MRWIKGENRLKNLADSGEMEHRRVHCDEELFFSRFITVRKAHSENRFPIGKGGKVMSMDINTLLLLVIVIELGMIYLKMQRK
jgi:hypothetical protein